MKQKDLAVIIFVIFMSMVVSIILSKMFITAPKNRQQKVEVVLPVSSDFASPNQKYFNANSVDPTQLIIIGENTNTAPFNTQKR